jgi:hypothetical protein
MAASSARISSASSLRDLWTLLLNMATVMTVVRIEIAMKMKPYPEKTGIREGDPGDPLSPPLSLPEPPTGWNFSSTHSLSHLKTGTAKIV